MKRVYADVLVSHSAQYLFRQFVNLSLDHFAACPNGFLTNGQTLIITGCDAHISQVFPICRCPLFLTVNHGISAIQISRLQKHERSLHSRSLLRIGSRGDARVGFLA